MDARFSLDAQHQVIVQFYPLRQGKRNANKDRIAKTLKNSQYVLATNLPFQAQFEINSSNIKAQTSTLTTNFFYRNYIHTLYFGKLSS